MDRRLWLVLALVVGLGALVVAGTGPAAAQEAGVSPERCAAMCGEKAQEMLKQCVDSGGNRAECRAKAQKMQEQCTQRCKRASAQPSPAPKEPVGGICKARCELVGQTVMRACMALPVGPTREQCQKRAAQAVRICIDKTCPRKVQPAPDPQVCKDRCAKQAREVYAACVKGSTGATPPQGCERKARQALEECLKKCTPSAVSPQPVPGKGECRTTCQKRVDAFIEECLSQPGANLERCEAAGAKKLEACLAQCP